MRESASSQVVNVQLKRNSETGYLIPNCAEVDFAHLAEYLSTGLAPEAHESDSEPDLVRNISKKRVKGKGKGKSTTKRSPRTNRPSDKQQRPAKRLKLDDGLNEDQPQRIQVQILKHIFELSFTAEDQDKFIQTEEQSLSCERDIIHSLKQKQKDRGDGAIEVGTLYPHAYGGCVQLCTSDPLAQRLKKPLPFTSLLRLPKLLVDDNVKDSDYDFHSRTLRDILAAAYIMQQNNRARIVGQLEVIFTAPFSNDKSDRNIPFKFRIEVHVSLLTPTVFEPLYPFKKKGIEVEEAQRRLLTYVFGAGTPQPEFYSKDTNVTFFLSCLRAAPGLSSSRASETCQPVDLRARLLPFQKRGVAWLLERESKMIDAKGQIVNLSSVEEKLPLFWERICPNEGTEWFLNRITGHLSDTLPAAEGFLGGILADEPGLGKTLESIALVLLNPSVDRDPSTSRWDPVGVIDVREVKVRMVLLKLGFSANMLANHRPL